MNSITPPPPPNLGIFDETARGGLHRAGAVRAGSRADDHRAGADRVGRLRGTGRARQPSCRDNFGRNDQQRNFVL